MKINELKDYLRGKHDVTFEQIVKDLKIKKENIDELNKMLEKLEKEKWLIKAKTVEGHYEYDPWNKQYLEDES